MSKNYYEILGINKDTTPQEMLKKLGQQIRFVQKKYKKDPTLMQEKIDELLDIYNFLTNTDRSRIYRAHLDDQEEAEMMRFVHTMYCEDHNHLKFIIFNHNKPLIEGYIKPNNEKMKVKVKYKKHIKNKLHK